MAHYGTLVRRDTLVRLITDLILDEGFATLTVGELAARFRCSRSTLYALESSKKILVASVLGSVFDHIASRFYSARSSDSERAIGGILDSLVTGEGGMSAKCFSDVIECAATKRLYIEFTRKRVTWLGEIAATIGVGSAGGLDVFFLAETVEFVLEGIEADNLPRRVGRAKTHCAGQVELLLAAAGAGSRTGGFRPGVTR